MKYIKEVWEKEKQKIPSKARIIYNLEDEIVGTEGCFIYVDYQIVEKYEELIDCFLDENFSGFEKMILVSRNEALETRHWWGTELHEFGIYNIKISKEKDTQALYFKDIFDKASGACIERIVQTAEMGCGMGYRSDTDDYEIKIKNKQKGIDCILKWSH